MNERWIVVGGGFRGIVGAYVLANEGKEVSIIERNPDLGGVLNSVPWKGFHLDKGCHLFDNDEDFTTFIVMEILGHKVHPVSVKYASITNRIKTEGFAIPDFGVYGDRIKRDILYELVQAAAKGAQPTSQNFQERLEVQFGATASHLLTKAVRKMYCVDAVNLDESAFALSLFTRIKFLDNPLANILKISPTLDDRVAASSQADPMRFYRHKAQKYSFRNFYPPTHGLRGFGEAAERYLPQLGISLIMGRSIDKLTFDKSNVSLTLSNGETVVGDFLLWTAGIEPLVKTMGVVNHVAEYIHHVAMVLYYFVIPKEGEGSYTYIHNFDQEDLLFRASVPGSYGINNCPDGLSYVCAEVPTTIGSPQWHNPQGFADQVWQELQRYEVVCCERPIDMLCVKIPTSYKMPKVGYWQALEETTKQINEHRLIGAEQWDFSKNQIIRSLQSLFKK